MNVKKEFSNWLLKNGANSYRDYYGTTIKEVEDKLDEINSFFEIDIFKLDTNILELKSFLIDNIYGANRGRNKLFFEYDKLKGNGRPKAILGKKNYFIFLDLIEMTEIKISQELFKLYWTKYKDYFKFSNSEQSEKYKWFVLKQVYDKWNWNSNDKVEMFKNSFEISGPKNLWLSGNFYPISHTSWMFDNFKTETINQFNNLFNVSST